MQGAFLFLVSNPLGSNTINGVVDISLPWIVQTLHMLNRSRFVKLGLLYFDLIALVITYHINLPLHLLRPNFAKILMCLRFTGCSSIVKQS